MNFKIYVIGNKIDKFFVDAIKEYEKRLGRYCKIELLQLKSEELLLKKLSDKSYKILVSIDKKSISSEELASKISSLGLSGTSDISIIIGADIAHDDTLTISPMSMDLGLTTTIVFEQIYRSYRIINNQAYHK